MKMRYYPLLLLAILLPLAAVAASSGTVFAQSYCGLQVGSVAASTQYSQGSYYGQNNQYNIQMTVPISTNCPNNGAQLWAVGYAYDTASNTNLGSANIVMNSNNGHYSGQLTFTLPSSVVEHLLQVQISVYNSYNNGQYSGLVATSSPTMTIHSSGNYNNNPYNGNNNGYYNGYNYYYNGYNNNGYCYYDMYGTMYCYSPYYYYYNNYYYSGPAYYTGSCFNGQAIIYYNGAYYYVNCYSYHHHH